MLKRLIVVSLSIILLFASASCSSTPTRDLNGFVQDFPLLFFIKRALAWMSVGFAHERESVVILRDPADSGKIIGRWFPSAIVTDKGDGTVMIHFEGYGYRGHDKASNVFFWGISECTYKPTLEADLENVYTTFATVGEPATNFLVYHITAGGGIGSWGDTVEHRKEAMEQGSKVFAEQIKQGFTVAMNKTDEAQTWIGIGTRAQHPAKPYWAIAGDHDVINEFVTIHEDGKDFIGPIRLAAGDQLRITLKTAASWGIDCYLVADSVAHTALASHVNPDAYPPQPLEYLIGNEGPKEWQTVFSTEIDRVVWVIVDNCSGGKAEPPTNGADDIVQLSAYVGVFRGGKH